MAPPGNENAVPETGGDPTLPQVIVTGDVALDHNLFHGHRPIPSSQAAQGTAIEVTPGGAWLVHNLLAHVGVQQKNPPFRCTLGLDRESLKELPKYLHSYAFWEPSPKGEKPEKQVWRMVKTLGYGSLDSSGYPSRRSNDQAPDTPPRVLVLDDGALGFRHAMNSGSWPIWLADNRAAKPEWVVMKMSRPVGRGDLWRTVLQECADRLVLVIAANELRQEEVGVSLGLSWEKTALELQAALTVNPILRRFTQARHLIVNFGSEGALWVEREGAKLAFRLLYDPARVENSWRESFDGGAFGYLSCFTASLACRLVAPNPDLRDGIASGLMAMRLLTEKGMGPSSGRPFFPLVELVERILKPTPEFSMVELPDAPPVKPEPASEAPPLPHQWSIASGIGERAHRPLYGLARRVARQGPAALGDLPFARFGKLLTIERAEMESLRGIQRLIRSYVADPKPPRPLSIAVFGAPGSGKSFGIKEIARGVLGKEVPILEFNLSQFPLPDASPAELVGAFHQVRDSVLKGITPVVFWDEFDSKDLLWLQYLLAPMQDGSFRSGQLSHPLGKCIFIFAGGTSSRIEDFAPAPEALDEAHKTFKNRKGPDFMSRLNGYLDVLGPNRRLLSGDTTKTTKQGPATVDTCFPVRRALLIRSSLGLKDHERLEVDSGLLTALLEVDEYRHGARSLETVVKLTARGGKVLRRSNLPPKEQFSLHLPYDDFVNKLNRDLSFSTSGENLAPEVYAKYCVEVQQCDEQGRPLTAFKDLSLEEQASNIAAAENIPEILSQADLVIVLPGEGTGVPAEEIRCLVEKNIDAMAEVEHDSWVWRKMTEGWRLGPRDKIAKTHPDLVEYRLLADEVKKKNREQVRSYPEIVGNAGFALAVKR